MQWPRTISLTHRGPIRLVSNSCRLHKPCRLQLTRVRHNSSSSSPSPTTPRPPYLHPLPLFPLLSAHTSLPTFLAHATSTSLSPTSPTYIGTHYEYTCSTSLRRLGLDLVRTGGRADKGIDLLGYWYLPSLVSERERPLRVLVQCKALRRKAGPNVVRELEGVGVGAGRVGWRDHDGQAQTQAQAGESRGDAIRANRSTIVLLCTPQEATKGVREAMAQSRWPMAYFKISLGGRIEQCLWNRMAAAIGLEGIGVVVRHVPKGKGKDGERGEGEDGGEEGRRKCEDVGKSGDGEGEDVEVGLQTPKVMDQEVVLTWRDEVWEWPLAGAKTDRE